KRALDVVVAVLALIILSPVLLIAALAIKCTSQGPVLFKQSRTGQFGIPFTIYKFRSMKVHSDAAAKQATKDDDRVTAVGRILRKTSIDELPQLLNVLQGHMSIVGPRPHAVAHDSYYGGMIPTYEHRFAAKPGLTGLAQVNNLRGETETVDMMAARIALDLKYIRRWSIWRDITIIIQTPFVLLNTSRAY
ncbi:MAG: exopolysaccharide biosynthesis polyprenyl glycosylphosphotransferase, partial [Pseudomonadota bacterium]